MVSFSYKIDWRLHSEGLIHGAFFFFFFLIDLCSAHICENREFNLSSNDLFFTQNNWMLFRVVSFLLNLISVRNIKRKKKRFGGIKDMNFPASLMRSSSKFPQRLISSSDDLVLQKNEDESNLV